LLGLDTNVLARIVLLDDPIQSRAALDCVRQAKTNGETLVVSLPALLELEWVMRGRGKLTKQQTLKVFAELLETNDLQIDGEPLLERALHHWENSSADFAECLFWAQYQHMGCRAMLTFDAKAARMDGVELLESV
jgi:predicted nucleic-acid-binding protein